MNYIFSFPCKRETNVQNNKFIPAFLSIALSMVNIAYAASNKNVNNNVSAVKKPQLTSELIKHSAVIANKNKNMATESTPVILGSVKSDQFNNISSLDQDQSKLSYMKRQIEISKLQAQLNKQNGIATNKPQTNDIHVIGVMMNQNGINLAQIKLHDGSILNLMAGEDFDDMRIKTIGMSGITVINTSCKSNSCQKTSFYPVTPVGETEVRSAPQASANPFVHGDNMAVPPLVIN